MDVIFHGTGNLAQLCQNFGISGGGGEPPQTPPLDTPLPLPGGYRLPIPFSLSCPQLNLLNPPRTKFLGTPLVSMPWRTYCLPSLILPCLLKLYLQVQYYISQSFILTNVLPLFYNIMANSIKQGILTLILLTWRIRWAPSNASRWQMGFISAFKGLSSYLITTRSILYFYRPRIFTI
jgi:hypothetical protein